MDRRQRPSACPGLTHASAKVFRPSVHLAYRINLLLFVVLAGWQSIQDAYLAQATDHAMAKDLARHLGQPDYEQVLETGQRRWLCHREDGTGSRDLTSYSQDLWLIFDQEGRAMQLAETVLLGRVGTTVRVPTSQGFRWKEDTRWHNHWRGDWPLACT